MNEIWIEPVEQAVIEDRQEMRKIYRQMKPRRPLPMPEAFPDALMVRFGGGRGGAIPLEVWAGYAEDGAIRRDSWEYIYRRFPPRSNDEAQLDPAGLAGDPVL